MPDMDGIATIDSIREFNSKAGIIIITGDGDENRAKLALARGACAYLNKPFNAEDVKTSITANLLMRD